MDYGYGNSNAGRGPESSAFGNPNNPYPTQANDGDNSRYQPQPYGQTMNDQYGSRYASEGDRYRPQSYTYNSGYGSQSNGGSRSYDNYQGQQNNRSDSSSAMYRSRPSDSYAESSSSHYNSQSGDNYSSGRNGDRTSQDSGRSSRDSYAYRSEDRYGSRPGDRRNSNDYSSRDNNRSVDSPYRGQDRSRYRDENSSFERGSYQSRGRGRGAPNMDRYDKRNSYDNRNQRSDDEEEESYSWKMEMEGPDFSKDAFEYIDNINDTQDELVTMIMGKLQSSEDTTSSLPKGGRLARDNEVIVKNIPDKLAAYQLQLILGTCGQVEDFYQLNSEDVADGVVAMFNGIAASFRAVRLLDRLQILDRSLDICPYGNPQLKQQVFNIELDWITLHNDDSARRLLRTVLNDYELHAVVTGISQDGYGPWVPIYKGEDHENKAWELVQCVYIGDQRARWFRSPQLAGVPMQRFVEKDKATLSEVIAAVDESVRDTDDCLIISSFIHDFVTYQKSDLLPSDAPKIMTMKSVVNIPMIIEEIDRATITWSARFPHLKIIWLIPHPVNFAQYNQILVSNAGFNINLEEKLERQHEADARVFYSTIHQLKDQWRSRLKKSAFILLSEIFFKKSSKAFAFQNDERLAWPKNFTVDGLNPAEKMTRCFRSALERWLKTIGTDPFAIAHSKNYSKPPSSGEGVFSLNINGVDWKCGESSTVSSTHEGHLERLDALWKDEDSSDEPPNKRARMDDLLNQDPLAESIDSVKSNIMNILNVHSKIQSKQDAKPVLQPEYFDPLPPPLSEPFSIINCRNILNELLSQFGILTTAVQSFIETIDSKSDSSDLENFILSDPDTAILLKTIIDKLKSLEARAADADSKAKFADAKRFMEDMLDRCS